jgi:3-deoxy-manno-octulosonate cytidylyltransferase (CMP-KDO synthetase)
MKTIGIIPARYASSRLPGKPLALVGDIPMIQHVYQRASAASLLDEVWVATDDHRILERVHEFNGNALLTSPNHTSGTDRCAEAVRELLSCEETSDISYIVNVQGDEPFLNASAIDKLVKKLHEEKAPIATLVAELTHTEELFQSQVVKVVRKQKGEALYFSRQAIPFLRDVDPAEWLNNQTYWRHIGIYGFQLETLLQVTQLPVGQLEQSESLEQLRWLENGYSIQTVAVSEVPMGVDTPADLQRANALWAAGKIH